jgi:hypothetical protein
MHSVIGRVIIKPDRADEALSMLRSGGAGLLQTLDASAGYWSRGFDGTDLIQHSFWLFETEELARAAEAMFGTLRDMPDAPATFLSVDVCEVIQQA